MQLRSNGFYKLWRNREIKQTLRSLTPILIHLVKPARELSEGGLLINIRLKIKNGILKNGPFFFLRIPVPGKFLDAIIKSIFITFIIQFSPSQAYDGELLLHPTIQIQVVKGRN